MVRTSQITPAAIQWHESICNAAETDTLVVSTDRYNKKKLLRLLSNLFPPNINIDYVTSCGHTTISGLGLVFPATNKEHD